MPIHLSVILGYSWSKGIKHFTPTLAYIMNKLCVLLFFIVSQIHGQGLRELYIDKMKSSWEIYESDEFVKSVDSKTDSLYIKLNGKGYIRSLIDNQKEAINERANLLSEILNLFEIEFTEMDSLTIMEQKSLEIRKAEDLRRSGVLYVNDSLYGYVYDLGKDSVRLKKKDYFVISDNSELDISKLAISVLIRRGKINLLDSIARLESNMLSGPLKGTIPKTEFEIVSFNKKNNEELKVIYLHETVLQIYDQ